MQLSGKGTVQNRFITMVRCPSVGDFYYALVANHILVKLSGILIAVVAFLAAKHADDQIAAAVIAYQ